MPSSFTDRSSGIGVAVDVSAKTSAYKVPVVAATTGAITLSGTQTIDGVPVVVGDRVLVKNQADQTTNGIYDVSASAWTRSVDFNADNDVTKGTLVFCAGGTVNGDVFYYLTTANPIVIGTSNITFGGTIVTSLIDSPTDNALLRANGVSGASLQGSSVTLSDAGVMSGLTGFTFNGSATGFTPLVIESTDGGAAAGPFMKLDRISGTPADDDVLGGLSLYGRNSAAEEIEYARIVALAKDVTDATEDGGVDFQAMIAGALSSVMDLTSAGLRMFGAGVRISSILDQDTMTSNSATALATQQSIKAYADTKARLVTGTYTGDGAATQAITGLGFQPKFLRIWESESASATSIYIFETTDTIIDDVVGGGAVREFSNAHQIFTDRIVSLDADGFTVGDAGTSNHPNSSGQVYNYMAMG